MLKDVNNAKLLLIVKTLKAVVPATVEFPLDDCCW